MNILVVEDEIEIAELIVLFLTKEGFSCQLANNGRSALEIVALQQPDVIILDWLLPGLDGLEVCTHIRAMPNGKSPYILMLTAKGEELDRVIGLSTGADDYMVKPISFLELSARVRALLRRSLRQPEQDHTLDTAHFRLDPQQRWAIKFTSEIDKAHPVRLELTELEFNLFATLLGQPKKIWTREELLKQVWGFEFSEDTRVVDVAIGRLRKKIDNFKSSKSFIRTVVGIGYQFDDLVSAPVLGNTWPFVEI